MKFPLSITKRDYNSRNPNPLIDQKYYPSIDGLRAVAVIMVIFAHARIGPNFGGMGVQIFFIISGFLITSLLLKEKARNNTIQLKSFYMRRFLRIIPLAYLFLFTMAILKWVFQLFLPNYYLILAGLFLINFHIGAHYIGHFWSLSTEEQFYFIFPFFLKKDLKLYLRFVTGFLIFIIFLDLLPFFPYQFPRGSFIKISLLLLQPFKNFDGIIIGVLSSVFLFHYRLEWDSKSLPFLKWISSILFIPILILLYTSNFPLKDGRFFQPPIFNVLEALLIAFLMILFIIPQKDLIYNILNLKVLVFIGRISYSLYVWQQIFVMDVPWKNVSWFNHNNVIPIACLILVSVISHYGFERPFLRLKKNFEIL